MSLSSDLISEFVKVTKDDEKPKSETVVYGTTVVYEGSTYVKLDGSELLTPVSTTSATKNGERVTVMIKDHTATITGNMSSPSARSGDVEDISDGLNTEKARINELIADDADIKGRLTATEAFIGMFEAGDATITGRLTAAEGQIENLNTDKLSAEDAEIKYATIGDLEATNAKFNSLDTTYATIDFANITQAAVKKIYADYGVIDNLVFKDGRVVGELVGVRIKGDLIEAGTLKADKLVVKGSDGLYYKLNIEGGATVSEQVSDEDLQNGLSGDIIVAKSIVAEKVAVDDLVAFGATIGGFHIANNSIYSEGKAALANEKPGIYFDKDGQLSVGDGNNYLRYFKDENGEHKLEISASSILMKLGGSASNLEEAVDNVEKNINYLAEKTEYISVGTDDDGNPYIELGKKDSDFKLRITNEKLEFYDGSSTPAYISNQKLMIKKAEVIDELQFGGFVWRKRSNGNMGLIWGEVNS